MAGSASAIGTAGKAASFDGLCPGLYAYTADGDPGPAVFGGEDGVVVVNAQSTPAMARIASVPGFKAMQAVPSHHDAVRAPGASSHRAHSAIALDATRAAVVERGQQGMDGGIGRFPRPFRDRETNPGPTWQAHSMERKMVLWLGVEREAQVIQVGRAHTADDAVVLLSKERALFAGDAVDRMRPRFGHWVIFDHCMPFNVSRAQRNHGHDASSHLGPGARHRNAEGGGRRCVGDDGRSQGLIPPCPPPTSIRATPTGAPSPSTAAARRRRRASWWSAAAWWG